MSKALLLLSYIKYYPLLLTGFQCYDVPIILDRARMINEGTSVAWWLLFVTGLSPIT